jgi:glycosyltransferase involved in cell wall biosynthesis
MGVRPLPSAEQANEPNIMTPVQASVIIATRNRSEKLQETLRRLAVQQPGTPCFEVIVVDDGSEPPIRLDPLPGLNIRLMRQEPRERSAARNAGASMAVGELLIFIDDDIWVASDFVRRHCQAHQTDVRQYVVGAVRLPNWALQTPFGRFRQKLEDAGLPVHGAVPPNFCAAGNLSIRRIDFLALGGFDPAIASGEDQDLALRAAACGVRGVYAPEIAVVHNDNALDFRSYCRRMEWGYRHMHPFVRRHPSLRDNWERHQLNGPLCLGREPILISLKKLTKLLLQWWPLTTILVACTAAVERGWPDSALLPHLYRALLGVFIFRGYRAGLHSEDPALSVGQRL